MGSPLCHFEFMCDDPVKCKQFYASVLGWKFDDKSFPGYTLIKTGTEPEGGLMKRPANVPTPCLQVYFLVDDIPATIERIKAGGGVIYHDETEIPNVGWFAIAADPEGIVFGLFKTR